MRHLKIGLDRKGHFSCSSCGGNIVIGQTSRRWYAGCDTCQAKCFFMKQFQKLVWEHRTYTGERKATNGDVS